MSKLGRIEGLTGLTGVRRSVGRVRRSVGRVLHSFNYRSKEPTICGA